MIAARWTAWIVVALVVGSGWKVHVASALDDDPAVLLPRAARLDLAEADRIDSELDRLLSDRNWPQAIATATRQLDLRIRHLPADDPRVARSYHQLGMAYFAPGLYERAQTLLEIALRKRRAILEPEHPDLAWTLLGLARVHKDRKADGGLERAEALCSEALRILRQTWPEDAPMLAPFYETLGHIHRNRHLPDAESLLRRSLELTLQLRGEEDLAVVEQLVWLSWFLPSQGHGDEARQLLARAKDILRRMGRTDHPLWTEATHLMAMEASLRDDWPLARRLSEEARQSGWDWQAMVSGFEARGYVDNTMATIALAAGDSAAAWLALENGIASRSTSLVQIAQLRARGDLRLSALDDVNARVLSLTRELSALDFEDEPAFEGKLLELLRVDANRILLESELGRRPDDGDPSASLKEVQSRLDASTAVLGWMRATWPFGLRQIDHAYVIRDHGGVHWVRLGSYSQDEVRTRERPERNSFQSILRASTWPVRVGEDELLQTELRACYEQWFAPVAPLLEGIDRLLIVREGVVVEIPVESMLDATGTSILDRYTVSFVPSASLLPMLDPSGKRAPVGESEALVVAAPVYDADQPAGEDRDLLALAESFEPSVIDAALVRSVLGGDAEALRRLPALPFALSEARAVASRFSSATILTGPAAKESEIETLRESGELERFRVIHFATHALLHERHAARSALVLADERPVACRARPLSTGSDGLVAAEEIYLGWRLRADLVTLSGCQTGAGRLVLGEPLGFLQALFRAGARSVVLSQWKVDDLAAALLMKRFYENLTGANGLPPSTPARALREAKLWLRDYKDASGRAPFRHPVYWAAFVLIGDPS